MTRRPATLLEIYDDHVSSFKKRLRKARRLSEKPVHQLRVEIKNLRILFLLLERLTDKKFKSGKLRSMFRPLFKNAGDIRTSQLNFELTAGYKSKIAGQFREMQVKRQEKSGKSLKKNIQAFRLAAFNRHIKQNRKLVRKLNNYQVSEASEQEVRGLRVKLREDMFDMNRDERLHEIRKKLKAMKNIVRLMNEIEPDNRLKSSLEKMDHTYELIGKWHDGVALAEELRQFVIRKQPASNKGLAFLLRLDASNERAKLKITERLKSELI